MGAVGVCGTDLHSYKGEWNRPTPIVLGHEGAGVVEAAGDGANGLRAGDRVVLSWAPACGACGACRRGRPAACGPLSTRDRPRHPPRRPHRALARGRDDLPRHGDRGAGGAGRRRGGRGPAARRRRPARAGRAPRLRRADRCRRRAQRGTARARVHGARDRRGRRRPVRRPGSTDRGRGRDPRRRPGRGPARRRRSRWARPAPARPTRCARRSQELDPEGVDYAFDAVGAPATTKLALRWTRGGGTAVVVGLPAAGEKLELDPLDFTNREKTLTGTIYGSEDPAVALPRLLDLVRAGELELASLVGPSFPLERADDAFKASLAGEPGRVLVIP